MSTVLRTKRLAWRLRSAATKVAEGVQEVTHLAETFH